MNQQEQHPKQTFVILWAAGPVWVPGKTVREQPYWDEHAAFIDPLFEQGIVVMGGPFTDGSGSLLIVEGESEQAAAELFARDPFVIHGIFARASLKHIKQWQIFLNAYRN